MTDSPNPAEAAHSRQRVAQAVDALRYEAIEDMATLAASCWRSVAEAAFRHERKLVEHHCRQAANVTREAFSTAKSLGSPPPVRSPHD